MKRSLGKKALSVLFAIALLFGSSDLVHAESSSTAYTVSFNVNGGSGTAPAAESASSANNDTVVLPAYTGTKKGYTFAGWSTASNLTSSTYYPVYAVGSTLTVSANTKLYAVWTKAATATFYIRLDGTTPYEPSQYSGSSYSSGITITNVLKADTWVCDTTGAKVLADLSSVPTDAQIEAVYPSYDPETQYVTWYVIKYAGSWHVDGVIQAKAKINLTYDGNGTGDVSNVPLGSQYYAGNSVTVGTSGGNDGAVTEPVRDGYTFNGWNTEADGSGTSYSSNDTFTINEATVLYAQWIPNEKTAYTIQWIDSDTGTVLKSVVRYGATGNTASVNAADKAYTGYTYAGDTYAGTVLSGTISGSGTLTLKIYFSRTSYQVTYQNEDGTVLQTGTQKYGDAIASYTKEEPAKEADSTYTYTFTGWKLTDGTEGKNSTVGTTELIYTAQYDHAFIDYTVTYDLAGGSEAEGTQLIYTSLHQGDATPVIADPLKASDGTYVYTFAGWSPAVDAAVSGSAVYTAQWTKAAIMTVSASSISGTYNGTAYTLSPASANAADALIEYSTDNGETWSTELPSLTNAGTVEVLVRASKEGYTTAETKVSITVKPRTVVLTSADDSKSYDQTALTNSSVTVNGDGFVSGEGAVYTVTGTQTEAGSSANTFTYVLNSNTSVDNYIITTEEGTLTVTEARSTTPVTNDDSTDSTDTADTADNSSTADTSETASSETRVTTPSTPNTGDQTNLMLYACISGGSLALIVLLFLIKHRYVKN